MKGETNLLQHRFRQEALGEKKKSIARSKGFRGNGVFYRGEGKRIKHKVLPGIKIGWP